LLLRKTLNSTRSLYERFILRWHLQIARNVQMMLKRTDPSSLGLMSHYDSNLSCTGPILAN
jgi:hypothetical protein